MLDLCDGGNRHTSMRPGSMSRERHPARRRPRRGWSHFNEARLHEPGEAAVGRRAPGHELTSMRPGSMSRERRAGPLAPARRPPDFNEARLHEPGEAPSPRAAAMPEEALQ